MSTSAEPWQPLLDALTALRDAWPAPGWSWDARFKVVTSSMQSDTAATARAILTKLTPSEWSPTSFGTAPDQVRALEQRCGDLRPGQLLFTGETVGGMIPFAMWWPWGDGQQVSVRIGIANSDRPKELYPLIRALFGIA